jgi:small-conductance mechanosensitive channel
MHNLFSDSLADLWADLHDFSLLWQIAALGLALSLGFGLARLLRRLFVADNVQQPAIRLGMESFVRVLSPMLALALVALFKRLLAKAHAVHLLQLAIPLIASFALVRLGFYILRRVFLRGGKAGSFLLLFEKVFALAVWGGVALYITGLWPDLLEYLETTVLPVGMHKVSLLTILQALVSAAVTLVIALWVGALLEERLMQVDGLHSSVRVVMARMGRAFLILTAVLLSLSLVGIDLTVLSVFGGALGVGLGLGMQKIASSYVSGFVILLERSLAIGDMVAVDKYYGKVTQINTRYTILQGLDGIESVVPNEMFVSSPVQNYSLTNNALRLAAHVTVSYQTDIEKLMPLMEQTTVGVDRVSKDPAPQSYLMKFGADGLELEVGFWIADPENGRSNVLSAVNRALWTMLQRENIKVPYTQHEVRIVNDRMAETRDVESVETDSGNISAGKINFTQ